MQGTLRALLAVEAPRLLPADRALGILSAVNDALFPLHAAGRAHGALDADHVLLDPLDEGCTITEEGEVDPAYAAPEVATTGPTPAGDAFGYAVLAHLLLAGDLPAFAEDGTPVAVTERHPGFPAFAGEALTRALQPDPATRPLPKVLSTLLNVVPRDRWPAASQADEPTLVVSDPLPPAAIVAPEPPLTEPVATADADTEPTPAAVDATPPFDEWRSALSPAHEVPRIDWRPEDAMPPAEVPAIDWTAETSAVPEPAPRIEWRPTGDPTRPAEDVPDTGWSANGPTDVPGIDRVATVPAGILPPVDGMADESATGAGLFASTPTAAGPRSGPTDALPAIDRSPGEGTAGAGPTTSTVGADGPQSEPSTAESHDPAFLHGLVESLRADPTVPAIEPLAESLPETALQHRPGKRRRRRSRESSQNRLQTMVLVLIVLALIVVGVVWTLTHKHSPTYDPTLQGQGASRSLVQPAPSPRV